MEEFKLRSLRLKAKAIGIAGSAALICALLLECCTFTEPAGAVTSATLLEFIGPKMITAFGLVEMAIVFSLLNYAVPQILTASEGPSGRQTRMIPSRPISCPCSTMISLLFPPGVFFVIGSPGYSGAFSMCFR